MNNALPLLDYVTDWMKAFKQDSVKVATLERLKTSLAALKNYSIAQMPICDITAFELQGYVNELTAKGYALTTIKKQVFIVTAPLRQAAAMHLIPADPTAGVKLPKPSKVKKKAKEVIAYTMEEQDKLWEIVLRSDIPAVHCIGVMLETGLRISELLALRWEHVSLERRRLYVKGTIVHPMGKSKSTYQDSPKSESSRRMIPLTDRALDLLRRQEGHSVEWVFTGPDGDRVAYQSVLRHIAQTCKNAHVQYRGAHVFRHTFATNCYYKHVDVKVLSKLLGHSDIRVTMNIYVNLHDDGFDEMYEALTS